MAELAVFAALALAWIAIEARAAPIDRPRTGTLALATGLCVLAGHLAGVTEHVAVGRAWPGALAAGGVLAAAGIALRAWAIVSLGDGFATALAAPRLVTTGPYRWLRHPSEVGLALISLGLALVLASFAALAAAAVAIPIAVVRCRREDRCLARDHGPAHASWQREVGWL